jgi:hypothetical protein
MKLAIETLYLSRVRCKDCRKWIKSNHFQEWKPQLGQAFVCPSTECNKEEKVLIRYDRQNTIDDHEWKQRLLRNTPYKNVPLIAIGTITVSKHNKNRAMNEESLLNMSESERFKKSHWKEKKNLKEEIQ